LLASATAPSFAYVSERSGLQIFTGDYWRLLDITGDYWGILETTGSTRDYLEITGDYWRLLEITGQYWITVIYTSVPAPSFAYVSEQSGLKLFSRCRGLGRLQRNSRFRSLTSFTTTVLVWLSPYSDTPVYRH